MDTKITPLTRYETRVYLPDIAGGFDVQDCPDAEKLAAFIVKACNLYEDLVWALGEAIDLIRSLDQQDNTCNKKQDISDLCAIHAAAEGK